VPWWEYQEVEGGLGEETWEWVDLMDGEVRYEDHVGEVVGGCVGRA